MNGIYYSNEFTFVMVRDYFKRTYCLFEFLLALAFDKPITVLLEVDERHGGIAMEDLSKEVPKLYYEHIIEHEIIKVSRDYFSSFVEKVGKRVSRHRRK